MFVNWTKELDNDGDEQVQYEQGNGDEVIDFLAQELDSDNTITQVDEIVANNDEVPDLIDMSEITIDEGIDAQDDANDQDDTAEQVETDEISQDDETQDENEDYVDINENDETSHLDDDLTEFEELYEDEEDLITENTDFETDLENSDSLFDQNDSLEDGENDEFEDEELDLNDFVFTDSSENDILQDDGDTESNFDAFSGEQFSTFGDSAELQVEDDMRHGERGDLEISLTDGEWLQDDSDLPDSDLDSELQLQFSSLSEISTEDTLFDFNFDDAGTDGSILGELADLESDDAVNMLDDLDSAFMIDDEFSDVESRF